jgi:hypothetical protein
MGFRIGVVCEGSHDFNVLSEFISLIIREFGETIDDLTCLQPEVSATFQITSGGWTQVRAWCQSDNGQGYRKALDQPLFSTSKPFDLIVVHLDGDVVHHCNSQPLVGLDITTMSVEQIIGSLKSAIVDTWMNIEPHHRNRIVTCIPVRHLEAWLSAGIGPHVADHEGVDMKDLFRGGPVTAYRGDWRQKYIHAAKASVPQIAHVRARSGSFRQFELDMHAAALEA